MISLKGILLLSPKYRPNFNLKENNVEGIFHSTGTINWIVLKTRNKTSCFL